VLAIVSSSKKGKQEASLKAKAAEESIAQKDLTAKKLAQAIGLGFSVENATKICPDCAETIKLQAKKCRFCKSEFSEDEVYQVTGRIVDLFLRNKTGKA
jgi:rRNA processing protein Krr1/Pno1